MKKLLLLLIIPFLSFGQETGCISGDCENGYGTYNYSDLDAGAILKLYSRYKGYYKYENVEEALINGQWYT